jgi:predicted amidohydrolase
MLINTDIKIKIKKESGNEKVVKKEKLEINMGAKYKTVPLDHNEIRVAAVQMNPQLIDPQNPSKGIKANLNHMLDLCDSAIIWPPTPEPLHLLAFPEFTLTGFDTLWTREDWLRIAIMVPGPETERIGKKAKELNCYIVFASHTQDPEWPGHFFNTSLIVSPEGKVIHTHWKAYAGFPGPLEYSTTVHDVLDEFVERYGWEAVWPVAKTPIGNIATYVCSEGFAPETARAFAMNGAEILVRCIANCGGLIEENPGIADQRLRMRSDCSSSHLYGIYTNSQGSDIYINGKRQVQNASGGGSMVIDPYGRILIEANDSLEQICHATIPIASFRAKHQAPRIRTEIYQPVLEQHPGRFPPNLYQNYLPKDTKDALQWSLKHARW